MANFFTDKPGQFHKSPNLWEGWQQNIFQQLGQQGQNRMQNPYEGWENIEAPARRQFETQTIPSLAERFTSMGSGTHSGSFQGALGQAGAGFDENMAAQKQQYGNNSMQQLMQMLQMALSPQTQTQWQEGSSSDLMKLLAPLMQGIGAGGSMAIG